MLRLYWELFFFSLLCLVVLFSWILRIARSLLWLSISFKSCTMLFSSLFDFQVNIYITVWFNLNFFPILESSPPFVSLILLSLILINELFVLFCLTLVSRAMFSPDFISIIRSPFLFFSICWYFSFSILHSVCSLLHLTFRLICSALFSTLFDFCGNSQAFFSSLSNFYIITFSFFYCVFSISALFVPCSVSLLSSPAPVNSLNHSLMITCASNGRIENRIIMI